MKISKLFTVLSLGALVALSSCDNNAAVNVEKDVAIEKVTLAAQKTATELSSFGFDLGLKVDLSLTTTVEEQSQTSKINADAKVNGSVSIDRENMQNTKASLNLDVAFGMDAMNVAVKGNAYSDAANLYADANLTLAEQSIDLKGYVSYAELMEIINGGSGDEEEVTPLALLNEEDPSADVLSTILSFVDIKASEKNGVLTTVATLDRSLLTNGLKDFAAKQTFEKEYTALTDEEKATIDAMVAQMLSSFLSDDSTFSLKLTLKTNKDGYLVGFELKAAIDIKSGDYAVKGNVEVSLHLDCKNVNVELPNLTEYSTNLLQMFNGSM